MRAGAGDRDVYKGMSRLGLIFRINRVPVCVHVLLKGRSYARYALEQAGRGQRSVIHCCAAPSGQ
jgi:hypothetical protein